MFSKTLQFENTYEIYVCLFFSHKKRCQQNEIKGQIFRREYNSCCKIAKVFVSFSQDFLAHLFRCIL